MPACLYYSTQDAEAGRDSFKTALPRQRNPDMKNKEQKTNESLNYLKGMLRVRVWAWVRTPFVQEPVEVNPVEQELQVDVSHYLGDRNQRRGTLQEHLVLFA